MDREFTLNVDGVEYRIEMDGNSLLVDGQAFVIGTENGILTVDGIVYDVNLGAKSATVDDQEYLVEAAGMMVKAAAPKKAAVQKKRGTAGENSVTAMMPGAILKVLVAEGDEVQVRVLEN